MAGDEIQLRFLRSQEQRFINEEILSLRHYLHSNNNKYTIAYKNSSNYNQNKLSNSENKQQ